MKKYNNIEQFSLFDMIGLDQSVIDQALRIGPNKKDGILNIIMIFRRNRDINFYEEYLKNYYGTNCAGFEYNNEKYSVLYSKNGMLIARGKTAQKDNATHLSWKEVAERISCLLDEGIFASQTTINNVDDYEQKLIAERIVMFYRDMNSEYKNLCFPFISKLLKDKYGYPDQVSIVYGLFAISEGVKDVYSDYMKFMCEYKSDSFDGLCNYCYSYSPEFVHYVVQGLFLEKNIYETKKGFIPKLNCFISDDEIRLLIKNHSPYVNSNKRIFDFFENNENTQDRAKFLQKEYGIGGCSCGNDNIDYNAKGLRISHYSPASVVFLTWSDVAKHINHMINNKKFT